MAATRRTSRWSSTSFSGRSTTAAGPPPSPRVRSRSTACSPTPPAAPPEEEDLETPPGARPQVVFYDADLARVYRPSDAGLKKALWILTRYRIPWFKHYRLGDIVDRACHALALDDERQKYGTAPPRVHVSVLDRIGLRTEGYAPGNVPGDSVIVGEDTPARLGRLETALKTTLGAALPLDTVRPLVRARQTGHLTALVALIALGLAMVGHGAYTRGVLTAAAALVSLSGLADLGWDLLTARPVPVSLLALFAIAGWLVSWRVRRRMQDRFAAIWLAAVSDLRPVP